MPSGLGPPRRSGHTIRPLHGTYPCPSCWGRVWKPPLGAASDFPERVEPKTPTLLLAAKRWNVFGGLGEAGLGRGDDRGVGHHLPDRGPAGLERAARPRPDLPGGAHQLPVAA